MKTITYQVPGTMAQYNPETDTVEEIDCPCTVGPMPYTAENLALARAQGIGEPIIADDGVHRTAEEVLAEMSAACNAAIVAGVDVGADHYSLTLEDQLNMLSLAAAAQAGQSVPYHADGQECRMYAPEEFQAVAAAATAWKTYQESYYNSLKQYILTMDGEALDQVVYGMPIPPEHQTAVLRTLLAQMEVQP